MKEKGSEGEKKEKNEWKKEKEKEKRKLYDAYPKVAGGAQASGLLTGRYPFLGWVLSSKEKEKKQSTFRLYTFAHSGHFI